MGVSTDCPPAVRPESPCGTICIVAFRNEFKNGSNDILFRATWAGGADEPRKDEASLDSAGLSFASHFLAPCLTLRTLAKLGAAAFGLRGPPTCSGLRPDALRASKRIGSVRILPLRMWKLRAGRF